MKFVKQLRGPLGAMPEGNSYVVGYKSMAQRLGMPADVDLIERYLGMPVQLPSKNQDQAKVR